MFFLTYIITNSEIFCNKFYDVCRTHPGKADLIAAGLHHAAGRMGHHGGSNVGHHASRDAGDTRGMLCARNLFESVMTTRTSP